MGAIFLSYDRDDRACAERIARVLKAAGHSVWWDRHIDSGEEFAEQIVAELNKAEAILVAWSTRSVKSRWVRDEAAVGGDTGRLVPVSLDGSPPPMGFRQFHTMDLSGWKGGKRDDRTKQLLHAVDKRLNKSTTTSQLPSVDQAPGARMGTRRNAALLLVAALLVAIAAAGFFIMHNRHSAAAQIKPTIALLPFTAGSPDGEVRELALQTRDSIAHSFSQSGLPLQLLSSVPADRSAIDFVISGDLSRNGDKVVAAVRLDEAAHGVTVYSHRFEATRADARNLPERIGAQLAGNLTWSVPLMAMDRAQPLDPALLSDLLQSYDFNTDPMQSYQLIRRVAAKAPNLLATQLSLAFDTAFVLDQLPVDERAEAVAAAREAADRAIELGPRFGDTYGAWCQLHSETFLAECENHLRAGRRVDPDAPFLNAFLSTVLRSGGRFKEALDVTKLSYTHDPFLPTKIGWMLRMLELTGAEAEARDLYRQGVRWWPEYKNFFFGQRLVGEIDRAGVTGTQRLEQDVGTTDLPPGYTTSNPLAAAVSTNSLPAARRACSASGGYWLKVRCMLTLSRLGDQDSAYKIADELYPARMGRTRPETERLWLEQEGTAPLEFLSSPAAAPLRRDPRFVPLAQRVGLLGYWRSGRPPDFCRMSPDPVCAQLLKRS